MNKFTKFISLFLVLIFVLPASACGTTGNTAAPDPTENASAPQYHIGIATLSYAQSEDGCRGGEAFVKEYGAVKDGGIVQHIVLPDNFAQEQETVISSIAGLADDPLMKAIVVCAGVGGTAAAFSKIREKRDDILLLVGAPQDDPNLISKVADIIVDEDNFSRGYYDIVRAKEMGAKTFVHMSFPRHMSMETLARRRALYEETCKDLGIEFVMVTTPDPAGEIGVAGSQQAVYEMIPQLVDQYGKDTVFFTTNTAQHEPIIKRVIEFGALFVCTDNMSPLTGWPTALGLDLKDEAGNWKAIVSKIEQAVVDKGQSGRMGCFAYSILYCNSYALAGLAKNILDKKDTGNLLVDIVTAYSAATEGCDWKSSVYVDASTNTPISNYYLLSQDVYILGKGYSGVMENPIPEKYYSVK